MSGECTDRYHEEPRLKFYDSDDETFPIPLKYVDVMRQTQLCLNNVSENIINDLWTEATGVNIPEEWTGTARFLILRTRLLEGFKCSSGKLSKIQKTNIPDSRWPEVWTQ